MMKPKLELRWTLGTTEISPRLLELLRGIAQHGSLQAATSRAGFSYRHAWGTLEQLENALGESLAVLERGRGAYLTPFAKRLLAITDEAIAQVGPAMKNLESALETGTAEERSVQRRSIIVHASHDLALARLRDKLIKSRRSKLDLHFQGSLDCLASLTRGNCDIAGFHVPHAPSSSAVIEQYRPWFRTRTLRFIHFTTRQQGLMVAKGNPLNLQKLSDLSRTGARFVNRQPGSGTRLFFDHLLAVHHIRPGQINGYQHEEFTHAAVAATIASGLADVAFGIEAAAHQLHLDFVPVASERYFLAARSATLTRPGPAALVDLLRNGELATLLHGLPGYALPESLNAMTATEAFH